MKKSTTIRDETRQETYFLREVGWLETAPTSFYSRTINAGRKAEGAVL